MEIISSLVIGGIIAYLLISRQNHEALNKTLLERDICLLEESCNNGNSKSCFEFGKILSWKNPNNRNYNISLALKCCEKGRSLNDSRCCWLGGDIYSKKMYGCYDENKAIEYYKDAIKFGDLMASSSLAMFYIELNQPVEAAKVLSEDCDKNNKDTCRRVLGDEFGEPEIITKIKQSIFAYYKKTHYSKCKNCEQMRLRE